jgi:hypothetical protein
MTSIETQAVLTYWHERTHNLSTKSYSLVKYTGNQELVMEFAVEFTTRKTLSDFYKMFDVEMPTTINLSSVMQVMVNNYQKAVSKLVEIGGIKEEDVILKIKQHIINGELDDQKTGLVNALYEATMNGEIIDKGNDLSMLLLNGNIFNLNGK